MNGKIEEKNIETAMCYYKEVRKALTGLFEICNINFLEKDIYHKAGLDNLKAINNKTLELLKYLFSQREVRIQLRDLEFDEKVAQEIFPL
jgi:hypothetical protein